MTVTEIAEYLDKVGLQYLATNGAFCESLY
ncbi:hypothetical protein HNP77_002084 [Treponema rectale]|uniref:Uncharacterized protein n=1 Tax=Treponema rectale TaxID=744512 RepID=A0A840SK26_9SPIR|nr:hypothetical protein [Treponema rectale]